jgi:hypothetical protein
VNQSPQQALRGLDDALSALAQTLFEAESSPDLVFVKSQADAGGPAAPAAAEVVAQLAELWARYPLAKDVVEQLETAVAGGDHAAAARLLGPGAVTLPDGGTMFVGALIDDLRARAAVVVAEAGRLAAAARAALSRLDDASATLQGLVARAGAVGAADDVEIEAATAALRDATAALAADPTDTGPVAAVDRALAAAGRRVEALERARHGLPAALAAARVDLDEIRRLIPAGAEAAALARSKIADPAGLLDPLDPAGVDGGGPGARGTGDGGTGGGGTGGGGTGGGGTADGPLGPWLARIEAQAQARGWEAAATELDRWRRTADRWLADARRVAEANGAAVARRNELRGLLQAFRAKSIAMGRAEDPDLVRLHQAAEQALYLAPCDLPAAEKLVGEYLRVVNATVTGGRR